MILCFLYEIRNGVYEIASHTPFDKFVYFVLWFRPDDKTDVFKFTRLPVA